MGLLDSIKAPVYLAIALHSARKTIMKLAAPSKLPTNVTRFLALCYSTRKMNYAIPLANLKRGEDPNLDALQCAFIYRGGKVGIVIGDDWLHCCGFKVLPRGDHAISNFIQSACNIPGLGDTQRKYTELAYEVYKESKEGKP